MSPYLIQNKRIAARFQFVDHAGKKILFLDYAHADRATCLALTAEFDHYVQGQKPDGSMRILFDMESPYYDPAHANHWRSNSARYEKYFYATAFIHIGPVFKMILSTMKAYLKMVGKPMHEKRGCIFSDTTAALDFLSQD